MSKIGFVRKRSEYVEGVLRNIPGNLMNTGVKLLGRNPENQFLDFVEAFGCIGSHKRCQSKTRMPMWSPIVGSST